MCVMRSRRVWTVEKEKARAGASEEAGDEVVVEAVDGLEIPAVGTQS